jgi:hypothetical protein
VLGRAGERAGELAEYADRARIAGQQCERDYDALTMRGSAESSDGARSKINRRRRDLVQIEDCYFVVARAEPGAGQNNRN